MKVIASSIRKGNIIEKDDGQLYVVLSAESFHPGKGTPTTQIDMRRLSDGVKTTDRYKTTEQVERAYVEDSDFNYLYQDGDGYTFMNAETYDQVIVPPDVLGEQAVYLQEGMTCILSMFNGTPVGIQLPARVTLEIVDTEPAMKGQTASSSYKPAKLSNGVRIMVPPHIQTGTKVVVQTEDGSLRRTRQGLARDLLSRRPLLWEQSPDGRVGDGPKGFFSKESHYVEIAQPECARAAHRRRPCFRRR